MNYETSNFLLTANIEPLPDIQVSYSVSRKMSDGEIPIAFIEKTPTGQYIKTIGDRLQNYVCTYELYKEFIQVVDEAFDRFEAEY